MSTQFGLVAMRNLEGAREKYRGAVKSYTQATSGEKSSLRDEVTERGETHARTIKTARTALSEVGTFFTGVAAVALADQSDRYLAAGVTFQARMAQLEMPGFTVSPVDFNPAWSPLWRTLTQAPTTRAESDVLKALAPEQVAEARRARMAAHEVQFSPEKEVVGKRLRESGKRLDDHIIKTCIRHASLPDALAAKDRMVETDPVYQQLNEDCIVAYCDVYDRAERDCRIMQMAEDAELQAYEVARKSPDFTERCEEALARHGGMIFLLK